MDGESLEKEDELNNTAYLLQYDLEDEEEEATEVVGIPKVEEIVPAFIES